MRAKIKVLLKKLDALLEARTGNLQPRQKMLICLGAWLVPVVLIALLAIWPRLEESDRLQEEVGQLETEISRLQNIAAQLDQHQAELEATEGRLAEIGLMLPEQREIPDLLTNISNLGTDSGLEFILFRPQNEVPREFYAEIPVEIAVAGPFHHVGAFLDRVSKLPRIVTVNNLDMGSPSRGERQMYLNTTFTLLTYRFIEPEPDDED